jgi:hypothetical protein
MDRQYRVESQTAFVGFVLRAPQIRHHTTIKFFKKMKRRSRQLELSWNLAAHSEKIRPTPPNPLLSASMLCNRYRRMPTEGYRTFTHPQYAKLQTPQHSIGVFHEPIGCCVFPPT